jgi:mRNA interferase MazF
MKRGEIWTAAGGPEYLGKPRPVVIVQRSYFDELDSVSVCALTSFIEEAPIFRVSVDPSQSNGLAVDSQLMVDKITTLPKGKLRRRIGVLSDNDMLALNRAMASFLGLAG